MNIIYFGSEKPHSTSYHRCQALVRLGHNVTILDPYKAMGGSLKSSFWSKLHFRTGYIFLQSRVISWLLDSLKATKKVDLIWVDSGELFGKRPLEILKDNGSSVVLYNLDDPTGKRDGLRFKSLLSSLSSYDLVVVRIEKDLQELYKYGAKNIHQIRMTYDEVAHKPFKSKDDILAEFQSEVAFIGTWMRHENRDRFLLTLIKNNVPLSLWGDRWNKSPYWSELKPYYRGGSLGGRDYVAAIQGSKVCLGLLSKGNRDLHTTRSVEVPFAGGVLCAERTSEHLKMYVEGKEAMFWSTDEECAEMCNRLLMDDKLREEIRIAGMAKVRANKSGNEDLCREVLDAIK